LDLLSDEIDTKLKKDGCNFLLTVVIPDGLEPTNEDTSQSEPAKLPKVTNNYRKIRDSRGTKQTANRANAAFCQRKRILKSGLPPLKGTI